MMMNMSEVARGGKDYIGYDYKTIITDNEKASMFLDAYESFGWIADESMPPKEFAGTVTIKLKRDRKILNKAELTRLQQHFESCADEIKVLENSKTMKATMYSIVFGLIGTAFLAGSVFAVTNHPPIIWLCVILGIPGLVGWVLPYQLYRFFIKKRSAEITPLIEQKYDEIHEICEKGSSLLH
jgi:Flp pilus assembly protein TadB